MGATLRLDEAALARVRRVDAEQAADVERYAEQLRRWPVGSLSLAQRQTACQADRYLIGNHRGGINGWVDGRRSSG